MISLLTTSSTLTPDDVEDIKTILIPYKFFIEQLYTQLKI